MISFIGRWQFYKKLGYKGWVSLIPLYDSYCLYEALYGNGWMMLWPFGMILAYYLCFIISAGLRSYSLFIILLLALAIFTIYLTVNISIRLTHSFGRDGWWTLGTLTFTLIFIVVYGLGDFKFKDRSYPDYGNYDAIDGFIEYFRNQKNSGKEEQALSARNEEIDNALRF